MPATVQKNDLPCEDQVYRLAVYEAGHAIAAWEMGLRIDRLQMLPRPPMLSSEKTFASHSWRSFTEMLEIRVIELIAGQIAERELCGLSSLFSGDAARIDELTRLIAGLESVRNPEEIWFRLEDIAEDIFASDRVKAAVEPMAHFLFLKMNDGYEALPGDVLEDHLRHLLPRSRKRGLLERLRGKRPSDQG